MSRWVGDNDKSSISAVDQLSECFEQLFKDGRDLSDVTFIVDEKEFYLHRCVLASRSSYFRALLFGGMRESQEDKVELRDTSDAAFSKLIFFIYTGRIELQLLDKDLVLDILRLAHRYGLEQLVSLLSKFLNSTLRLRDVCKIFNHAIMFQLDDLVQSTSDFMDRHATEILESEELLNLSDDALIKLISRNSFCASELVIFRAVAAWCEYHSVVGSDAEPILECVRLPLIGMKELLHEVRPLSLASADSIMDAISLKVESRDMELPHRGVIFPNRNMAIGTEGAEVTEGEFANFLLDGNSKEYTFDKGFSRHMIGNSESGEPKAIAVCLAQPTILNHLKLLLWDKDDRAYCYYVEVSVDGKDYVKVIDYASYYCRSWQDLYFPQRVVRYIRIVGTANTANNVFHLVSLEAFYREKVPVFDSQGIIKPTKNVACVLEGATVIEGVSRTRDTLISGQLGEYDWEQGYTCHQLGVGAIVVQLAQPYVLGSMRLLLWDCDDRQYTFDIYVSTDRKTWQLVVKKEQLCRSWQYMEFPPRPVVFFQVVGTHNTANEVFHAVHFESPAQVGPEETEAKWRPSPQQYQVHQPSEEVDNSEETEDDQSSHD